MPDARPPRLRVLLHATHVATLTQRGAAAPIRLTHTAAALETWPRNTPLLSCSLPLTDRPTDATAFLDGFLPEGDARARIAADRNIAAGDTYLLLAELGRDIAGAVQVVTEDAADRVAHVEPYTPHTLAEQVERLPSQPLAITDDSELSLAGLRDKMTLVATGAGWGRPVGGHPSTHILKVEDRACPGMAALEAACLHLARHVGLTTVEAQTETIADIPCLIVSRFDRATAADGAVVRVHQEDLCQATGIDAAGNRGRARYQRHGGPSYRQAAALLRRHARDPEAQLQRLVAAMVFTVLIGNADAHGKNHALLHPTPGVVELAPLYDTVPTVLWPKLRRRCALEINGVCDDLAHVTRADLVDEVAGRRRWALAEPAAQRAIDDAIGQVVEAARELDMPDELFRHVIRAAGRLGR